MTALRPRAVRAAVLAAAHRIPAGTFGSGPRSRRNGPSRGDGDGLRPQVALGAPPASWTLCVTDLTVRTSRG